MEYKVYNDFVICPVPDVSELDMEEIEAIVSHTHNTWQSNRPEEEIREDTIQGKRAELVVERLLAENTGVRYVSYDEFRSDNYAKHAPFDGIMYSASISGQALETVKERINNDVRNCAGDTGKITVATREFLEDNGVFTFEIKSSLLKEPRDYTNMNNKSKDSRTDADYEALCKYIKGFYDYIVYPHYCRDNYEITSFYKYTKYVRDKHPEIERGHSTKEFLSDLMKTEFDNACNIYTRVFFDVISDEIIIPGYVAKMRFFEEPRIRKMPSPKSDNALYYMYHMSLGKNILEIESDDELQRFSRLTAYSKLFGEKIPECPNCGNELKLRELKNDTDKKKHKFMYVCENCRTGKWHYLNQIHTNNIN